MIGREGWTRVSKNGKKGDDACMAPVACCRGIDESASINGSELVSTVTLGT